MKKDQIKNILRTSLLLIGLVSHSQNREVDQAEIINNYEQIDLKKWVLDWSDEFNYDDKDLEKNWISQNGPTGGFVLCSRWRENAKVVNGVLELQIKKEERAGEDWTCGNVWTDRTFGYGYFEARYKYAAAPATNNSFWLWPKKGAPKGEKACEVDINEGHFPSIINTNLHNWTDKDIAPNGKKTHQSNQFHNTLTGEPIHNVKLKKKIKTKKLRLYSTTPSSIQISEFRIFDTNTKKFPNALEKLDVSINNLALESSGVKVRTNGNNWTKLSSKPIYGADNRLDTRWVSKNMGEKWIEFEWKEAQDISKIQIVNGWLQADGVSRNLITDYKIQTWDNGEWKNVYEYDLSKKSNFGKEYHTYGVAWDKDYFKFYFDGKLYETRRNIVCFSETNILLSLAILKASYAGPITDKLDGTSMKIDYVRYYKNKE